MEPARRRLRDECRGHFQGDLLLDEVSRRLYATDASIFEMEPLAVAVPRDEADVQFLVRYAAEQHLSLIPRGAGTGLAGEAIGEGIVVDLSTYFREITEFGPDWVRVQPGVIHRRLNTVLAEQGRRFAPDPASGGTCTIGGMLATNASGSRAFRHGYTRDHVEALRVVWDNAEADWVRTPKKGKQPDQTSRRAEAIVAAVGDLLRQNRSAIEASEPQTPYNRCGYRLHGIATSQQLDLSGLLIGSEGTLACFTEAVLKTIPLPGGRAAGLFGFVNLDAALKSLPFARQSQPSACELMDRRLLTLARGQSPDVARMIPATAEAVLLVEFEREDPAQAREAVLELIDRLQKQERLALLALPAFDLSAIDRLWQLREVALPGLYALGSGIRPLAFIEDIAVPVDHLPDFLGRLQAVLQRFETTASFLIHAATGQVHARPFLDLASPADRSKLWPLADAVYALVLECGGTISSQHGTGIARTPWVEKQYGPILPVLREVKRIFDPQAIFNPGKIIGLDPSRPAWPLRVLEERPPSMEPNEAKLSSVLSFQWQSDEFTREIASCNGCGDCRTEQPHQRMCPMFRVTHAEAATPRAKANMLRTLLAPGSNPKELTTNRIREVAELCINCKMCAHECPAHVNIPKLMLEAKAAHHREHGLDRSDWMLARIESFAAFGGNFALMTNTLLTNSIVRWGLERFFGLSRHRRLPTFAPRNFLKIARRRGLTKRRTRSDRPPHPSGIKVAYFIDTFANYIDPLIAEAAVAILHHHGIEVYVPPQQIGCGVAPLARGDVEMAKEVVGWNLRLLADVVRDGYTVVCTEPTAALMLRQDALDLLDDADAALVAQNTTELMTLLHRFHEAGQLRTDFQPLDFSVGHHVPCHVKALGLGIHGPSLLSLIPRLRVHTIDRSCSGMAGTYGLKARNYATSLEAGKPMLDELRNRSHLYGSTECSSCRMQMEEGGNKRTLHPVEFLALAYGLVPEITRKLREPLSGGRFR